MQWAVVLVVVSYFHTAGFLVEVLGVAEVLFAWFLRTNFKFGERGGALSSSSVEMPGTIFKGESLMVAVGCGEAQFLGLLWS